MSRTNWLTALAFVSCGLPLALSQASCAAIECGEGTVEQDGVCVPADSIGPNNLCGNGTVFDPNSQSCISALDPTICDLATSEPIVGPDGITTCVGTGVGGCDITCKNPDSGKVTVCGQLINAEDNTNLESPGGGTGVRCDIAAGASDDGPCSIGIEAYDAVTFAGNPTGTPALAFDEMIVNDCGQFMVHNVPRPMLGFLALAVNDHSGSANDTFNFGGVAFEVQDGQRITGFRTYVVKHTTDEMWTTSAGSPFGMAPLVTFGEKGVFFPIFLGPDDADPGKHKPYPGVTITVNGSTSPGNDYYFSDSDPNMRTTIETSLTETGLNGAGLIVNSDLVNHSGMGAEPTGCEWPTALAAALEGVIFANERIAEDTGTGEECM